MSGILIVLIFLDNFLGPIGVLSHLDDLSLGQKISVDRSIGFTCDKFDDSVVFDCQNIEKNDIRRVQAESRRLISKFNNICEFPLCLICLWHFFNNWYAYDFFTLCKNELFSLVILRLKDVRVALCYHLIMVSPQMFGNSHIKIHNPHTVSLDTFAEATEIIPLIHHNWRVNARVILLQIVQLKKLSEV